jgi:F-box interacting protein
MVDPSLPFFRKIYDGFEVKQCSGGLLLCECWEYDDHKFDHVVCNPMTGQWAVLPIIPLEESGDPFVYLDSTRMFLGFDAALLSGFTVFMLLHGADDSFSKMAIYTSKTRRWTTVQIEVMGLGITECVFLDDTMHLATDWGSVFTIDTKGEVWGNVGMPEQNGNCKLSIGQSRGRLHAWRLDNYNYSQLRVWVLEDYVNKKWTLKHTATVSELFGRQRGKDDRPYSAFAIHPDCNCIFLADKGAKAVLYDMDNQEVNVICISQEFKDVLPYTPCFAKSLDGR